MISSEAVAAAHRRRRASRRRLSRSSTSGGAAAAEQAFLVANRPRLKASAFANTSRAAVSSSLGGVRVPDRPTFSTAMKAATAGRVVHSRVSDC
jgi:hypothetical protein